MRASYQKKSRWERDNKPTRRAGLRARESDQIMLVVKAARTVVRDICLEQLQSLLPRFHRMFLQRELFQLVGKLRESTEAVHLGHNRS
jgi:hypothetical protein